MNIAGVIVHSRPELAQTVKERLLGRTGVEVHAVTEEGRLVVTVEEDDAKMMADTIMDLHNVEGVLSAAMVYHHYEEEEITELEGSK